MINWSSPYYLANHHFDALIQSVNISCYSETTEFQSYVYNKGPTPDAPTLSLSNQSTVLSGAPSTIGSVGRRALVVRDAPILSLINQSTVMLNGAHATFGSLEQLRRVLVVVVGLILISCIL